MALKYLQNGTYNLLYQKLNREFLRKPTRPYFELNGLNFKGIPISVAVPFRGNIHSSLQESTPQYIFQTPPTAHTDIANGKIAGWHILKMIPFDKQHFYTTQASAPDLIAAENIAIQNYAKMQSAAQDFLNCIERGEPVFGAVQFERALSQMNNLKQFWNQKQTSSFQIASVPAQKSSSPAPTIPIGNISNDINVASVALPQTQQTEIDAKLPEVDEKTQAVADCLAETLTNPKKKKLLIKKGKFRLAPVQKALAIKSYDIDPSITSDFSKQVKPSVDAGDTCELGKLLTRYIRHNPNTRPPQKQFEITKEKCLEQEPSD